MSGDHGQPDGGGSLALQLALLRDDVARLTADAQRAGDRVEQLKEALRSVRGLLPHLPPHDSASVVAVRLRRHFEYLATTLIDDALASPGKAD